MSKDLQLSLGCASILIAIGILKILWAIAEKHPF